LGEHFIRSPLPRIPLPADILLEFLPNIQLTEVFSAKASEYGARTRVPMLGGVNKNRELAVAK